MGHPNQVMEPQDHRDLPKSQDQVTMHHLLRNLIIMLHPLKGLVITPRPHKDQVIMAHLLKDQVTMGSKNLIMEVADQPAVLVHLKIPDPTTTMAHLKLPLYLNNNSDLQVCSKCYPPPI